MPEGPSLVILKEEIVRFSGKKILAARGNAEIDMDRLVNKKILEIRTWANSYLSF